MTVNKISKNLSYKEATHSNTAIHKKIDNTPNNEQLTAMQLTSQAIFEPCRRFVGAPLHVSSFFRSEAVNKAIGGSATSQHFKGQAIDIDAQKYGNKSNVEIFNYIKENLSFDQLIWEFGNDFEPDWVHCSYVSEDENRQQILIAEKENGKTKYTQL